MTTLQTDWAAVQTALISWIETATGRSAQWRDDRQYVGDPNPHFLLHIQNIAERGIQHLDYEYDSVNDVVVPRISRLIDVLVEVSCIANNQAAGFLAQQELEKLKVRARMPANQEILEDAGLALMTNTDVGSIPFQHQGRALSQATTTFLFSLHDIFQDSEITDDYIEAVNPDDQNIYISDILRVEPDGVIIFNNFDFWIDEENNFIEY